MLEEEDAWIGCQREVEMNHYDSVIEEETVPETSIDEKIKKLRW